MRNSTTPLSNSLFGKLAGAGSPLRTMAKVVIAWSLVTMPAVAMNSDISLVTATSEVKQLTQEQQNRVKTVLFVDRTVADYQDLISQLSDESSVVVLDADKNGVLQISETLAAYQKLDSIQILSHGHPGQLSLGSSELNNTNLDDYQSALQGWGKALVETGDILLYGCNVAQGEAGNNFVHQLSELTGADIAASSDVTGSDMLGANWLLEKQTDKIEVSSAIPEVLLQQYKHLLVLPTNGFQDIAPVGGSNPVIPGFVFTKETVAGSAPVADVTGDPTTDGVYYDSLPTTGNLSLKIDADGTNTGTFDLTGISLTRFGVTGTFTFTITGLDASGTAIPGASTTINSPGGTGAITDDGTYTNFTGIAGFRIVASEATGTTVHNNITYAGFTIANVAAPVTNSAPTFDVGATTTLILNEDTGATTISGIGVTDTDVGDTLTWSQGSTAPLKGSTSFIGTASASGGAGDLPTTFTYTPTANLNGPDTFTIDVSDGNGGSDTLTVNVTINSIADISADTVPANAVYGFGSNLDFTLAFDEAVTVTGSPRIALDIGGAVKYATYVSGSTSTTLTFRYTVEAGLTDANGIAVTNAVDLSGGTIVNGGALAADLSNVTFASTAGVLVDSVAPTVSSVTVPANATYIAGQNLDFIVNTSENVTVNTGGSTPTLALTIGATGKSASYVSGSGTSALLFRYTVEAGLSDTDGIAIGVAISLNSATMKDAAGNDLTTTLNSVGNLTAVLVDSIVPTVSSVSVPSNATYSAGQNLDFTVNTSENVTVNTAGGTPALALTIGATGKSAIYVSGTGTSALLFRYTVESGLTDTNGITLGATISLNSGTIKDATGNDLTTTLNAVGSLTAVLVDSAVPSVSSVSVPTNATYTAGQNLDFTVNFNENITMVGTASTLGLTIGASGVNATYQAKTATSVTYRYTVQAGDLDTNGIAVGTMTLNGDTIKDSAGNNATLTLNSVGVTTAVLVDAVAPVVSSVSVPANATYAAGQALDFTVNFNENITMVGTASTLGLTIGASGVNAAYQSKTATSVTYHYTVQAGDLDANGIAVGALTLNGGTIKDSVGNNATLTLNSVGVTTAVLVDAVAPVVSSVSVPANATYTTGQTLDFTVNFGENITMVGTASTLGLTIGASGVNAAYQSKTATSVTYRYTVQAGDLDTNGIAVGTMSLNADTIKDSAGNNATLTLNSVGVTTAVLVDAVVPVVSSVSVPANATYVTGQTLDFTVTFNENITMTGTASTLGLTVGASSVNAAYQAKTATSVTYRYTIQAGDLDASGIAVGAITPNGDTIKDSAGNNATLTLVGVGSTAGVLVDASAPSAPSVPDMTTATDTGASNTDNQTGVRTPVFTGTAETGSTVTLSSSVQGVVGSVVASGGNWSITSSTLSLGAHNITASATDVVGNISSASSALVVTILSDLDGDGDPDITDPDIDGDGMSNAYEDANGLNKLDANDRDTDLDGDGVSNFDEFAANSSANADDYPPVVTPPADITIDATGLFTAVDVGTGSANDALDGAITATSNASTHFAPGGHLVTWSATDATGNTATATQLVNVNPIVSLSKNQVTAEGDTASFSVILNGDFVNSVSVPYTVSGTALTDGSDHDLVDGTAIINSGTSTSININIVDDGAGEGTETIVITLGTPINAAIGSASTHTVEVIEGNVAPTVNLSADQGTGNTLTIAQTDGVVSVSSVVTDPNALDSHSYDWSLTDNALSDTDGVADTFSFDPLNVIPGFYTLRLSVNDGTASSAAELTLEVLATAPVLTTADSDGDGTDDQSEGYGDSDGDGIADYLDAIVSGNVLQIINAESNSYLIETEVGLVLRLGDIAFQTGNAQAEIIMSDITNAGGSSDDASYNYDSGLFDIVVEGGKVITLVIPQRAAIPANAIYRNLTVAGWSTFVEDSENLIYSAAGEAGYCPPPGDAAYQPGLTEGNLCIQLTIVDGGANDADGVVNNRVANLGGVTKPLVESGVTKPLVEERNDDDFVSRLQDAIGSADPWWLLMMFSLLPLRRRSMV